MSDSQPMLAASTEFENEEGNSPTEAERGERLFSFTLSLSPCILCPPPEHS